MYDRLHLVRRGVGPALALALISLAFSGCKTGKPEEEPPPPKLFEPATPLAQLSFEAGRYPDLFAPTSFALWVDESVTALRREQAIETGEKLDPMLDAEAARVTEEFIIIELHIESMFSDMSIAYDVVGLRDVPVYLSTPGGQKIMPIQEVIGTPVREEQRQALKLYGRTNLVIFPKHDLWTGEPVITRKEPVARLVIEAYNSRFYFEWPNAAPEAPPWMPSGEEVRRVLSTGYNEFAQRVQALAHIFD